MRTSSDRCQVSSLLNGKTKAQLTVDHLLSKIVLTGQVYNDDDDDDRDFQPDEDDDDDDASGMMQFRDPSDNRFLSGFELRHFGLGSPPLMPVYDDIDLRQEEQTPEDKSLQ